MDQYRGRSDYKAGTASDPAIASVRTPTPELADDPSTCWTLDDSAGVYFSSGTDRENSVLTEFGWNSLDPELHDGIDNHDRSYLTSGSSSLLLQQEENWNYARFTEASGFSEQVSDQVTTSNNQSVSSSSNDDPPEKSTGSDEKPADIQSKVKKKVQKRIRQPRFAFMTKSDIDHLEDGYRWRKYGQKAVKNSPFPRSYYRCTNSKCTVKKRVERSSEDPSIVITTYEGQHCHHTIGLSRGGIINHNVAFVGQMPPQMSQFYYPSELPRESFLGTTTTSYQQVEDAAQGSRSMPDSAAHPPTDEGLLGDMVPHPLHNR